MRIGIVTDNYFPSVGGTEISIWNYTRSLEEQGHTVFVFCPNMGKQNPKKPRSSSVRLPSIRGIYPDHPLLFIYPGITKLFRKYNLDVIHSQTPVTAPYVAEYVARKLDVPHVFTMHTLVPEQIKRIRTGLAKMLFLYLMQSLLLRSFKAPKNYLLQDETHTLAIKVRLSWIYMLRLVQIADSVIFPAKPVQEIFRARGFDKPSHLLPTFSNMFTEKNKRHHHRNSKEVRIVHVGRLDIEKRPQVLIDAVNLLPEYLNWKLIVIGDGNQRSRLMRLVRKYNLEEKVVLKGRRRQSEIAHELLKGDIFVMPSFRFDTQGIVLLEACGAGLPIVYCDDNLTVGAEKSNSILTKPYAMSISQGIQQLIEDADLRQSLGKASFEIAKKYKPEKLTRKLIRIYKGVLRTYHSPVPDTAETKLFTKPQENR